MGWCFIVRDRICLALINRLLTIALLVFAQQFNPFTHFCMYLVAMKRINNFFLILMVLHFGFAQGQSPYLITVPYLSTGLVKPVEITNAFDDRLFIVEKDGRIRIVENDTLKVTPFLDINARVLSTASEQGLLGLTFDPEYATNGYFFVNYIDNNGHTVISRFSVDPANPNQALPNSEVIYLTVIQPYNNHNAGDIEFGPDSYLYIPLGDGGSANDPQNRAQNKKEMLGKILRIDVRHGEQYLIPPDNPFIGDTSWLPEIWSAGLRNPWKAAFDAQTGDLWMGDVGQGTWEEIDMEPAGSAGGLNYGWRCYEGLHPFNTSGCQPASSYTDPVYEYQHLNGNCSVTGGVVYRGGKYGLLSGHYLFSDYCVPSIRTLKQINDTTFNYLAHSTWTGAGISIFGSDMYGEVYLGNLYNGHIRKIVDTVSCAPAAWLADEDTFRICAASGFLQTPAGDSLTYTWYRNGNPLSANTNKLAVSQNGTYVVQVSNLATGCSAADTVFVQLTPNAPVVNFALDSVYCVFDGVQTLAPSPGGGTFSGYGISGNQFDPSAVAPGKYLIQYSYTSANGCNYKEVKLTEVRTCTGLSESPAASQLTIAPNPGQGAFTVSLETVSSQSRLVISDLAGRMVSETIIQQSGLQRISLDLSSLQNGMYMLQLINELGVSSARLMLQR